MNKWKGLFLLVIGLVMIIFTVLSFSDTGKLFFLHESAAYLTQVSRINLIFSLLFLFSFFILLFFYRENLNYSKILLLGSICVMWLLCGRTVGFKAFPDGRLNLGWYILETQKFHLCKDDSDCEIQVSYKSKIEPMSLWRVRIVNSDTNRVFFIGPFAWDNSLKILKTNIGVNYDMPYR